MTCPTCEHSGKPGYIIRDVPYGYYPNNGSTWVVLAFKRPEAVKCPACHGTGRQPTEGGDDAAVPPR